jgi:hypothetical protein
MNGKLKIWQTAVDSFNYAFENFKTWLKLSIAPWIFGLIFLIIGGFVFISSNFFLTTDAAEPDPYIALTTVSIGSIIMVFGIFTATLMLATNYFRYLLLNEGGVKWLEFRFDRHMWEMLKVSLVWLLIFAAAAAIDGVLIHFFPTKQASFIIMAITLLVVIYISLRFVFAYQFAATDVEKPIKSSFETTKGNLWKIIGLLLLVMFFSVLLSLAGALVSIPFKILENLQNVPLQVLGYIGDVIIQIITSVITTAAGFTALVKAYQAISGKEKKEPELVVEE